MSSRSIHGQPVDDTQIQTWADAAERGYDPTVLKRRGRPTAGDRPGAVVTVRIDAPTLAALEQRAEAEELSRSEALRAAVRTWVHGA